MTPKTLLPMFGGWGSPRMSTPVPTRTAISRPHCSDHVSTRLWTRTDSSAMAQFYQHDDSGSSEFVPRKIRIQPAIYCLFLTRRCRNLIGGLESGSGGFVDGGVAIGAARGAFDQALQAAGCGSRWFRLRGGTR